MTECFLTSQIIPHIDKRKLCELACQNGNDTNTCRSTSEFAQLYDLPNGGINLRPGSPCDNFQVSRVFSYSAFEPDFETLFYRAIVMFSLNAVR